MFEFEDEVFSKEELEKFAISNGLTLQELLDKNKNKIIDISAKMSGTNQGAIVPKEQAPNMGSFLETSFLDSQEKNTAIERTFGKNALTDFFGDIYRAANKGLEQASLIDPSINLYKEGTEASDETILNFIKANKDVNQNIMQSDEMRDFNKIYEEEGGGWWGFVKGAANNPSVLTQELVSSIAMQIASLQSDEVATATTVGLATGAITAGAASGGLLAVPGGIAGAMGGAMAALETGLTFSELLSEELGEDLTVENVRGFLQNEEKLADLKNKALGRGLTIGAVELATMGIARGVGGKIAKAGFKASVPTSVAATGAIEIAGGATGEIAGRFVAGQEMDVAEIGFEAFAGLGSAPVSILGQSKNIGKGIAKIKINKELANTEYKNISDLFLNEEKTSDTAINLTKIKNADNILVEEINNKIKNKTLTEEQGDIIKEKFGIIVGANEKLNVLEYNESNKNEIIDLLLEKKNLENKINQVNEAALTKPYSNRVQEITTRLNEIAEVNTEKSLKKSVSFAEKAGKALGLNTEVLSQNEIFKKYGKEASESDGFIKNGKIIINKDVAASIEIVTVGSHEVLHGILNEALKGKDANKIVNQFKKIIGKEQLAKIEERLFAKNEDGTRLYSDEYIAANPDEYFTLFSDAIIKNQIKYNENIFTKLGDLIRPILRKLGFSKIKFDTGRDVYNFLKEYNTSVKKGELSKDILNLNIKADSDINAYSKTPQANKIQEIYNEKGKDGAFDIIQAYKPLTAKLTNNYRNVPGFDFELLQSEIEIGKRGLLDLINTYNPAKGTTLNTYIQGQLKNRSIEAANRILDTEFKLDVTEAKGVTDIATEEQTEATEEAIVADEIKSLRKEIGLPQELITTVKEAVIKTFGTRLPNPQDPKFRLELQKRFRTELKKPMAKFVGKQDAYESFLRDNFKAIYDKMPLSLILRRFKEFAEPVLDENGKQKRERTAEGKKIFTKKKLTIAEFVKYFLGSDVGRSTQGTRKTAIVEAIAEEIAFDATMEVINAPDISYKYEQIAELAGDILPDNFLAQIAKQIDRNEDFKFSKKVLNDSGKSGQELSSMLFEGFIEVAGKLNPEILEVLLDEAWAKRFPRILEEYIVPGYEKALKNKTLKEQADITKYLINIISRPLRTSSSQLKNLDYNTNTRLFRRLEKIGGPKLFGKFGSGALIQLEQIKTQNEKGEWSTKSYIRDKDGNALGSSIYNTSTQTFHKNLIIGKLSREEVNIVFNENRNKLKEIIFILGEQNPGLALSLIKLTQKDQRGLLRSSGQIGVIVQKYKGDTVFEHRPPVQYLYEQIADYLENPSKEKKEALNKLLDTAQINVVPKDFANIVDQDYKSTLPEDGSLSYDRALKETNYEFDGTLQYSKSLNKDFNKILEQSTGVKWTENYSSSTAKMLARCKGKGNLFIPYSAEDFVGLLYTTLAKGKIGDQQMEWYNENLIRPFSRGIQAYETEKQRAMREWAVLKKRATKDVPGGLKKKNESGFTNEESLRMYIWQKQGIEIPNIKKGEVNKAIKAVRSNQKFKEFADTLMSLNPEGYPDPSNNWIDGDITSDLVGYINGAKRAEFLTEWKENVDQIFSEKNKTKLRALYGDRYVEALEDMLFRMEKGTNRSRGTNKQTRAWMDWVNNSVGTIMFFNARSAVLQTLSTVNFINFSDNNPLNAAAALANFGQYRQDFVDLFNSDFLKQRRTGLQIDVNADEIAKATKGNEKSPRAILRALLQLGFTPTQIADSFAIAAGGATFYRNRINKYIKEGLSKAEAEKKAFTDFQEIAEETQQSARPDRISMEQASSLGRVILAFANTPMQYARLQKKAFLDLINNRGDWKTNISKIMYYGVIQNVIFSALQQALFALLFDDEDEAEEKDRYYKIGNASLDTFLRGVGVAGAGVATVKNIILEIINQAKSKRPDYTQAAIAATSVSPPINSKLRKLLSAGRAFTYKQSREKIFTEGFSLENPALLAAGQVLSAGANIPADRLIIKADHLYTAIQPETELWQAIALSLGWSEWDLGMIEKQTKKSKPFNPRDIKRNINRGVKRKKIKR